MRVFLADDHSLIREGLRGLLEQRPGLRVAGEAASGDDVLARAARETWDVLVLDLSLPGTSGLDLVAKLKALQPRLRILVLTMRPPDAYAVRLVRAGIDGYVTKDAPPAVLLATLDAVAAGERRFPDDLEFLLLDQARQKEAAPHEQFSTREMDIFRLYVGGLSTNGIAEKLGVDASTVSTHLRNIRTKLGVKGNRQIITYASTHGLLTPERAEEA